MTMRRSRRVMMNMKNCIVFILSISRRGSYYYEGHYNPRCADIVLFGEQEKILRITEQNVKLEARRQVVRKTSWPCKRILGTDERPFAL
jgi:hypothetical protein